MTTSEAPIRILAIDGGGVRGLAPATILARLEDALQAHPCEHFDLIAGTSTGSLIAAGLTDPTAGARELARAYRDRAAYVLPRTRMISRLALAQSRTDEFQQVLDDYVGHRLLRDAHVELVVPAFDLCAMRATTFTRQEAREMGSSVQLRDVVIASSAAPTYLPPHPVRWSNDGVFVDGGVFANNPSLIAWELARRMNPHRRIRVLSIGCGTAGSGPDIARGTRLGSIKGRAKKRVLGDRHDPTPVGEMAYIADVCMSATSSSTGHLMEAIVGDDYLRINPVFDGDPSGLDDSRIATLNLIESVAERTWSERQHEIMRFVYA